MEKNSVVTKILAVLGTVLVWLPLVAPVVFGIFHFIRAGWFQFDFLMPAEFFPVALAGSLLLVAASVLAGAYGRLIIGGFAAAGLLLLAGIQLAEVSGLASGEIEPGGPWFVLVVAMFVLYILALTAVGVGGVLLLRRLLRRQPRQAAAA